MSIYLLKGLNIDKFLKDCKEKNIIISSCKRLEYNCLKIKIGDSFIKSFVALSQSYNYEIRELKPSAKRKIFRFLKANFVFVLLVCFILFSIPIFSNFVYKMQVYGLSSISQKEIEIVLNKNGYAMGKSKGAYDLKGIEKVLQKDIENISYCSAIIKGNTLILNVHEKIDLTSDFYDYKPIVAPIDCIIERINLLSGTSVKKTGETCLCGVEVVLPKVVLENQTISVPAKATIKAIACPSISFFVENGAKYDKTLEKKKNILYNMLLNLNVLGNIDEEITKTSMPNGENITISLHAQISF